MLSRGMPEIPNRLAGAQPIENDRQATGDLVGTIG
jgi:hypothetical protein